MEGGDGDGDAADDADFELPPWSRTLAQWRDRFKLPFTMPLSSARRLTLEQAPCVSSEHAKEASESADGLCTASTVWDAGVVLAAYLYHPNARSNIVSGRMRTCLDLGSGTGIVGLAAAARGTFWRVVLTDLPSVVPLLRRNAEANRTPTSAMVEALPLRWEDGEARRRVAARGPFDLIVGGDLLYRPQVVAPLIDALLALAGPQTSILLAASLQHSPETLRDFRRAASASGFSVEQLRTAEQHEQWRSDEVKLLHLRLCRHKSQRASEGGGDGGGRPGDDSSQAQEPAPRKKPRATPS